MIVYVFNVVSALSDVSIVRVTAVFLLVMSDGVFQAITDHPLHIYHSDTVALIFVVSQYLYTHLHVTSGHHVICALHIDGFHVPFTRSYIQYTHALFLHGT